MLLIDGSKQLFHVYRAYQGNQGWKHVGAIRANFLLLPFAQKNCGKIFLSNEKISDNLVHAPRYRDLYNRLEKFSRK